MKPSNLTAKIFLDSGNPMDTQSALETLGFLDGQTTNPSLAAKSPAFAERLARGEKMSRDEAWDEYKKLIVEISEIISDGSISVEVYADKNSTVADFLDEARKLYVWAPNLHVKLPTTAAGIEAASILVKEGMRINMTLCFSLAQAAAIHVATQGCAPGQVYVSPFIGRLEDRGQRGMDLIKNILKWYAAHDSNVQVLAASIRSLDHFNAALQLKSDIITAPLGVLQDWAKADLHVPEHFIYHDELLMSISYEDLPFYSDWKQYDIQHPLTDAGIEKFASDWNALLK